jgi:hypothetical protein
MGRSFLNKIGFREKCSDVHECETGGQLLAECARREVGLTDFKKVPAVSGGVAPASRYQVSGPKVIRESFEGEVILVHLDTGTYYSLRGAGAALWTMIEASASLEEIADGAAASYEATQAVILADLEAFVSELLAEDLISAAAGSHSPISTPPLSVGESRLPYQTPVLERFSDMQELLLLDPVHDVGEDGWPLREEDAKERAANSRGSAA